MIRWHIAILIYLVGGFAPSLALARGWGVTTGFALNLRAGPSTLARHSGRIEGFMELVYVIDRSDERETITLEHKTYSERWLHIKYGEDTGWVYGAMIEYFGKRQQAEAFIQRNKEHWPRLSGEYRYTASGKGAHVSAGIQLNSDGSANYRVQVTGPGQSGTYSAKGKYFIMSPTMVYLELLTSNTNEVGKQVSGRIELACELRMMDLYVYRHERQLRYQDRNLVDVIQASGGNPTTIQFRKQ